MGTTLSARGRHSRALDGTQRRTPMWALLALLVLSALMVPLFLLGNSEDRAMSGSTPGTQRSGGEQVSRYQKGSRIDTCRDAPVEFRVDGQRYTGAESVSGKCVPAGRTRAVTVRYDPDDPQVFTTLPRQWVLYGFAGAAALGFLAALVALVRRLLGRRRRAQESGSFPALP